jgi:hypothetical protein
MCGENSNPLLTYSMSALGAKVHVAAWPSFFNRAADLQTIADIACRAIAYQNSSFVISSIGAVSEAMRERLPAFDDDRAHLAEAATKGGSAIYAPGGAILAGPMAGGEGIIYADADLGRIVPRKIVHDYSGDYHRFDIFQLVVNVSPGGPPIRLGAAGLNAGDVRPSGRIAASAVQAAALEDGRTLLLRGDGVTTEGPADGEDGSVRPGHDA